jgi:IS30 family transposase
LNRVEGRIYCAHTAHQHSVQRSSTAKKTSKCHDEVKVLTRSLLLIGLSPEQISGRMGKTYRKGTKVSAVARLISNRVDISERPSSVDDKQEVGHWEADTVYGQDGYWVTLVKRVSKMLLTCRVKNKTKQAVTELSMGCLSHMCHTA